MNMHPSLGFTGKERDAETGLDYFGARYFSGGQGRFTSPDPIRMAWERLEDPQQLNLYSYVRNNPLAYVDDDGQELQAVTVKFNSGAYGIGFVDNEAVQAFTSFNYDLAARGYDPTYTYLFRTTAEQQEIYDNPARAGGNPVALPGTSAHESGLAFDINRSGLASQGLDLPNLRSIASRSGYGNLGGTRSHPIDPPHFQFTPRGMKISRRNVAYLARIKENQRSYSTFQRLARPGEYIDETEQEPVRHYRTYVPAQPALLVP